MMKNDAMTPALAMGLILIGAAFNVWVALTHFTLARLEDVFVLPFWLVWMLVPYAYPLLVLRRNRQPGPAAISALALLVFCLAGFGVNLAVKAGVGNINPFVPMLACAAAILAHWLACIVLGRPFALPWHQEETEKDNV